MVAAPLCLSLALLLLQSVTVGKINFPRRGFDTEPKIIHEELPAYPHEALPQKVDGIAWIEVTVGREGEVTDAKVDRSSKIPAIDEAALDASYLWKFEPASKAGQPVPCQFRVPFNFKVPDYADVAVNVKFLYMSVVPSEELTALAYSPTGMLAGGGEFGLVRLYRIEGGELSELKDLRGPKTKITSLAFRPDAYLVAAAGEDGSLQTWSISVEWTHRVLRDAGCPLYDLVFSADGTRLVTAGCKLELWDLESEATVASFGDNAASYAAVGFSSDGSEIYAMGRDGSAEVWDAGRGELLRSFEAPEEEVSVVDLHAGSGLAALGFCNDRIELLRLSDGAVVDTLSGDGGCVEDLEFTPDGTGLVTTTAGWGLRYWNTTNGSIERTYVSFGERLSAMCFRPAGDNLAWANRGNLQIWEVERLR